MCILLLFIVFAPLYLWLARWLLRPVFSAAVFVGEPVRFQLIELGALTLYVSIALTLGTAPQRSGYIDHVDFTNVMTGSLMLMAVCLWWIAVRTLSQAKIHNPRRRGAFLLLAVPLAYLTPLLIPIALFAAMSLVAPIAMVLFIMIFVGAVSVVYGCHWLAAWVAKDCPWQTSIRRVL